MARGNNNDNNALYFFLFFFSQEIGHRWREKIDSHVEYLELGRWRGTLRMLHRNVNNIISVTFFVHLSFFPIWRFI